MIRVALLALVLALLATGHSHAAAPPPGSPQAEAMAPYGDWVRGLANPTSGIGCCSVSDCRMVNYRMAGAGYEAFIDRDSFPGAPDKWLAVPDSVVLHTANPTGFAVACWAAWHTDLGFFCFDPASGT